MQIIVSMHDFSCNFGEIQWDKKVCALFICIWEKTNKQPFTKN